LFVEPRYPSLGVETESGRAKTRDDLNGGALGGGSAELSRYEQREAQRPQGRGVPGAGTGAPHAAAVGDGDAQPIKRSGASGVRGGGRLVRVGG